MGAYLPSYTDNSSLADIVTPRSSVFINTALAHWAFRMSSDPSYPIDTLAFTESANTHPLPFKVVFEPRFSTTNGLRELLDDYAS